MPRELCRAEKMCSLSVLTSPVNADPETGSSETEGDRNEVGASLDDEFDG